MTVDKNTPNKHTNIHKILIAENLVDWTSLSYFMFILPKAAKEKLWCGVYKVKPHSTTEPNNENRTQLQREFGHHASSPDMRRLTCFMRTSIMLHMTRIYRKQKQEVPENIISKLHTMSQNVCRFIIQFLKQSHYVKKTIFASIYEKIVDYINSRNFSETKTKERLKQAKEGYDELMNQDEAIKLQWNQTDFYKTCYFQYLIQAYMISARLCMRDKNYDFRVCFELLQIIKCKNINIDVI